MKLLDLVSGVLNDVDQSNLLQNSAHFFSNLELSYGSYYKILKTLLHTIYTPTVYIDPLIFRSKYRVFNIF